jgi:hypothetical protein
MLLLRTSSAMHKVADTHPDPRFRALLSMRLGQLDQGDGADLGELVRIVVFEAGDTLDGLNASLGFNPFQGGHEWIKRHDGWWEVVWIFSDWGDGAILFVQAADGVEPRLIDMCKRWAVEAEA